MIKMHCDRCGKEIEGTSYYTIDIYANDINPTNNYGCSLSTAAQNFSTNMKKTSNHIPQYCEKCRDEIEEFINNNNGVYLLKTEYDNLCEYKYMYDDLCD